MCIDDPAHRTTLDLARQSAETQSARSPSGCSRPAEVRGDLGHVDGHRRTHPYPARRIGPYAEGGRAGAARARNRSRTRCRRGRTARRCTPCCAGGPGAERLSNAALRAHVPPARSHSSLARNELASGDIPERQARVRLHYFEQQPPKWVYARPMELALLIIYAIPLLIGFLLVYWAVRLAIRHEKARERRD